MIQIFKEFIICKKLQGSAVETGGKHWGSRAKMFELQSGSQRNVHCSGEMEYT